MKKQQYDMLRKTAQLDIARGGVYAILGALLMRLLFGGSKGAMIAGGLLGGAGGLSRILPGMSDISSWLGGGGSNSSDGAASSPSDTAAPASTSGRKTDYYKERIPKVQQDITSGPRSIGTLTTDTRNANQNMRHMIQGMKSQRKSQQLQQNADVAKKWSQATQAGSHWYNVLSPYVTESQRRRFNQAKPQQQKKMLQELQRKHQDSLSNVPSRIIGPIKDMATSVGDWFQKHGSFDGAAEYLQSLPLQEAVSKIAALRKMAEDQQKDGFIYYPQIPGKVSTDLKKKNIPEASKPISTVQSKAQKEVAALKAADKPAKAAVKPYSDQQYRYSSTGEKVPLLLYNNMTATGQHAWDNYGKFTDYDRHGQYFDTDVYDKDPASNKDVKGILNARTYRFSQQAADSAVKQLRYLSSRPGWKHVVTPQGMQFVSDPSGKTWNLTQMAPGRGLMLASRGLPQDSMQDQFNPSLIRTGHAAYYTQVGPAGKLIKKPLTFLAMQQFGNNIGQASRRIQDAIPIHAKKGYDPAEPGGTFFGNMSGQAKRNKQRWGVDIMKYFIPGPRPTSGYRLNHQAFKNAPLKQQLAVINVLRQYAQKYTDPQHWNGNKDKNIQSIRQLFDTVTGGSSSPQALSKASGPTYANTIVDNMLNNMDQRQKQNIRDTYLMRRGVYGSDAQIQDPTGVLDYLKWQYNMMNSKESPRSAKPQKPISRDEYARLLYLMKRQWQQYKRLIGQYTDPVNMFYSAGRGYNEWLRRHGM